jgi:hypothetical protein
LLLLNTSNGIESGTLEILEENGAQLIVNQAAPSRSYSSKLPMEAGT